MNVTSNQMAEILGLSKGRVSQLKAEGVFETEGDGKYALGRNVRAYIAFLETGPRNEEVAKHRAKLLAQQTRRLALQNDREAGQLMSAEDVRQVVAAAIAVSLQHLNAIPGRCAGEFAAMTDRALI